MGGSARPFSKLISYWTSSSYFSIYSSSSWSFLSLPAIFNAIVSLISFLYFSLSYIRSYSSTATLLLNSSIMNLASCCYFYSLLLSSSNCSYFLYSSIILIAFSICAYFRYLSFLRWSSVSCSIIASNSLILLSLSSLIALISYSIWFFFCSSSKLLSLSFFYLFLRRFSLSCRSLACWSCCCLWRSSMEM